MFDNLKKLLGVGKAEAAAALVREVVCGREAQSVLFEPENAHALKAYVEYGHSFSSVYFPRFLKTAERKLVQTYLEMGFELDDKEKQAVLELKDDELSRIMMDSGSWRPFPFGSCMHHSAAKHHEHERELSQHDDADGVVMSV